MKNQSPRGLGNNLGQLFYILGLEIYIQIPLYKPCDINIKSVLHVFKRA